MIYILNASFTRWRIEIIGKVFNLFLKNTNRVKFLTFYFLTKKKGKKDDYYIYQNLNSQKPEPLNQKDNKITIVSNS